jgi:IclR family acetate operon transcriptional repressor
VTTGRGPYAIEALDLGLRVLPLLLSADNLTVSHVAKELEITRSRAHRILCTLELRGYVTQRPEGHRGFRAGPALLAMCNPPVPVGVQLDRLRHVVQRAVEVTQETVHATMLLGPQLLFVHGQQATSATQPAKIRAGTTRLAHATTAGKLLLSYLTERQIEELFPVEDLLRYTPWTVPTRTALMTQTERIRIAGVAQSRRESAPDLAGVAVALDGTSWRDRTALVASVPIARADPRYLRDAGLRLEEAVRSVRVETPPSN